MITRINSTYSITTSEPTTTKFFNINAMLQMNESLNNSELPFCDGSDRVQYERKYLILPILLISCFIAMVVNIIVISSSYWIRCSMTPNVKISLSLAAADATSSTMYGLLLLISEYGFSLGMIPCLIDLLRLSGIVITVVHLLALSLNHYIGILKPLHYNSIVTSRKVSAVIWVLWLVPFVTVVSICTGFDSDGTFWNNFLNNTDVPPLFMDTFSFRITYSSLFFVPIFIMMSCYSHILIVVKKQQNRWNNLSRIGSKRIKGKPSQKLTKEHKQLEGNVRAIYTTLLIVGSCVIGWTPALLIYTITCTVGCYISGENIISLNCKYPYPILALRLIDNILIILKMLANPIIYSIRMREIKDGTYRMYLAALGICCKSRRNALECSGFYYRSRMQNSIGGGTVQVRVTSVRNGKSNFITTGEESSFL